jgi:nitrous oxide reductase accessory protein NosL
MKLTVALLLVLLLAGCKKQTPDTTPVPMFQQAATLPHCANLLPICKGGLISQHHTPKQINDYVAKYPTKGCRFVEPPRCGWDKNGQPIRTCLEECTP